MLHSTSLHTESGVDHSDDQSDAFARDLTALSRKHGIAINGNPVLFVMDTEDANLSYQVDAESRLVIAGLSA